MHRITRSLSVYELEGDAVKRAGYIFVLYSLGLCIVHEIYDKKIE